MQIESKNENGVFVLTMTDKRLDAKLAIEFRAAIDEFIKNGHHAIVLNMSSIEFIDSSGLGAIVACLKMAGSRGKFILYGLTPPVISMFKITRMDRVFNIYDTEQQALQAIQI